MKLKTYKMGSNGVVQQDTSSETVRQLIFPMTNSTGEFKYKNEINFEKDLMSSQDGSQIKIINQLCTQKGNVLEKLTSIKFGDQIITIKDLYQIEAIGRDATNKKRIRLFKKSLAEKEEGGHGPRLTNNLAKNYIKAFVNYVQDMSDRRSRQSLLSRIRLLIRSQKFNNNFIQKIINDEQFQPLFTDFLLNQSEAWIENSKIKNKKIHLEARKIFLKLKRDGKDQPHKSHSQSMKSLCNEGEEFCQIGHEVSELTVRMIHGRESQKDSVLANESQSLGIREKIDNDIQLNSKNYSFDI